MKSEPEVYSIDSLKRDRKTYWEGVRNHQAKNFMTQQMKIGDDVLFYHSNADPPGVAGIARVSGRAVPDRSALDSASEYYDLKASPANPIWFCVQVEYVKKFDRVIGLDELKKNTALKSMLVLKKGTRLSIQPVKPEEFSAICKMAGFDP